MPEINLHSPARSIHCKLIDKDLDPSPRSQYAGPYPQYLLPNDRGALLSPGTHRLPLDRHKCAETLWRFFGDMGRMDANGEEMEALSQHQIVRAHRYQIQYVSRDRTTAEFPEPLKT
jgi:hypothetical protein